MQNKFAEFSKEYGLIVVGYSGFDRSVMDVLNYLLKHDDYFGNGIYWCFRKGDSINKELRRLLWKDRVYYVEIDGFDELFAEINHKISKVNLVNKKYPFESKIVKEYSDIINDIKSYKDKFIGNEYISNDLEEALEQLNNKTHSNHVSSLKHQLENDSDDTAESNFNSEELNTLITVDSFRVVKNYDKALEEINKTLGRSNIRDLFISELYMRKFEIQIKSNNKKDAVKTLLGLISHNELNKLSNNQVNYIKLIELSDTIEEKLGHCETAINIDNYNYKPFYIKAGLLKEHMDDYLDSPYSNNEVADLYKKSIILDPSLNNPSYKEYIDFLINDNQLEEADQLIEDMEKQNRFDLDVFQLRLNLLEKEHNNIVKIQKYAEDDIINNSRNPRLTTHYKLCLLEKYIEINEIERSSSIIQELECDNFLLNKKALQAQLIIIKSRFYLECLYELNMAVDCLEEAKSKFKSQCIIRKLLDYKYYKKELDDYEKLVNYIEDKEYQSLYSVKMYFLERNLDKIPPIIYEDKKPDNTSWLVHVSYNLLKLERYDEVINILKEPLDKCNYSDKTLVINYELARKNLNDTSAKKKRLGEIIKTKKDDVHAAAAHAILSKKKGDCDYKSSLAIIQKIINQSYSEFYRLQDFPVFETIDFKEFEKQPNKLNANNNKQAA